MQKVSLLPEQYFDIDDIGYDVESVPKSNELIDYIDDNADVIFTSVEISDANQNKRIISINYFNEHKSFITNVRIIKENITVHCELIVDVDISTTENYSVHDSQRYVSHDGSDCFECIYHGLIKDNTDGSESETIIWSRR